MVAVTIAYHVDLRRVGERCLMTTPELEVSRVWPMFAPPTTSEAKPLEDRYLSRSPIVKLTATSIEGNITIDGVPLKGRLALDPDALARGVVVELADRVVLVIHRVGASPAAPRHGLVGDSDAMARLRADITRVADLAVPVLVRGESGSGKELVASALHEASPRAGRAFVGVNIAALPATTAASELFGHARGAFTGAAHDHDGLFVRADGGTLFLDEIGEAPLDVQPMMLRVLETREIVPLGGSKPRKVDVRVIAATDADLEMQIAENGFREALFHRLAGFQILVPPLRERRDDIGRLLVHFLREELAATGELGKLEGRHERLKPWLPASLVARLVRHHWPGNVRQLRNAARQLAIASRGADQARIDPVLERLLATVPASGSNAPRARRDPSSIGEDELLGALRGTGRCAARRLALDVVRADRQIASHSQGEGHPGRRAAPRRRRSRRRSRSGGCEPGSLGTRAEASPRRLLRVGRTGVECGLPG